MHADDYKLALLLLEKAKGLGATNAKCVLTDSSKITLGVRNQKLERFEESRHSKHISVKVWIGEKVASVSSGHVHADRVEALALKACELARESANDPFSLLAEKDLWPKDLPSLTEKLHLVDKAPPPDVLALKDYALAMEDAARGRKGITGTESAFVNAERTRSTLATSKGFQGSTEGTNYSAIITVVTGEETERHHEHALESSRFWSTLQSPDKLGRKAAKRALRRIGAQSVPTQRMPIVFDRRVSRMLLALLLSSIGGESVYDRDTFLKDKLGKQIFPKEACIIDDPHMPGKPGSRPFDGDGVATHRREFIKDGVLTSWMMSLRSAKKLGLSTTGHASGASNFYMRRGVLSRSSLISSFQKGLLVTGLMGFGGNLSTGDYSQGVAGFLIENGAITRPVYGVTIAGNLVEMFANMTVARDLEFCGSINAPTLSVGEMMVAGK